MVAASRARDAPHRGAIVLIGNSPKKPNIETVRRIKRSLHAALDLPEDALITVAQLACLEDGCEPVETVIGLHRFGSPQLQHKVHKSTECIVIGDLVEVCLAWGFQVDKVSINTTFNEF